MPATLRASAKRGFGVSIEECATSVLSAASMQLVKVYVASSMGNQRASPCHARSHEQAGTSRPVKVTQDDDSRHRIVWKDLE